jgi:putative ABC transport system permease protein
VCDRLLTESLLLALLGGVAGAVPGAAVTVTYTVSQDWPAVAPLVARPERSAPHSPTGPTPGPYSATGAAQLPPTDALRSV